MRSFLVILLVLVSLHLSAAITPLEGLYFNPDASGRGVAVEVQNGTIVATYFGYKQNGDAQWWQGIMFETSDDVWEGDFGAFENGQCFGCGYVAPDVDWDNVFTGAKIELITNFSIEFTGPAGTEILVKQNWAYEKDLDYVYGMWMTAGFSSDLSQRYSESVVFWGETGQGQDRLIMGNLSGYVGTTNRIAVATDSGESNDNGEVYILVDISSTRNALYKVVVHEGLWDGQVILLDKNDNPVASYVVIGKQLLNGYEIGADTKSSGFKSLAGDSLSDVWDDVDVGAFNSLSNKLNDLKGNIK